MKKPTNLQDWLPQLDSNEFKSSSPHSIVYIMTNHKLHCEGIYKIGFTTNFYKRLVTANTFSPDKFYFIRRYFFVTMKYERHLHKLMNNHRVSGEFFKLDCEDFMDIDDEYKRLYPDGTTRKGT